MTWVGSGIVKHPRTAAVVSSQPTVRAFRTDTGAAHGTTATAGADGVATFTDLVDDVEYVAYADLGLPTWAVVPLTYQFQIRAVPDRTILPQKLKSETVDGRSTLSVTPSAVSDDFLFQGSTAGRFLVRQTVTGGINDGSGRAFLFSGAIDVYSGSGNHEVGKLQMVYGRAIGVYRTNSGTNGLIDVTLTNGGDVTLASAGGGIINLRHDSGTNIIDVRRTFGAETFKVAFILMVLG